MAKQLSLQTHVKPVEMKIFLWGIVAIIVVDMLAKFNIVDWTWANSNIITMTAALFVLVSVGVMQIINRSKGTDPVRLFGANIALMAIGGVIAGILSISIPFLITAQGFVDIALGIYVIIEIFR